MDHFGILVTLIHLFSASTSLLGAANHAESVLRFPLSIIMG
jgi:hypothetical protein